VKAGPTRLTTREREVYDQAVLAWRAGAIADFYFGARSPRDATVIWTLEGVEYLRDALEDVGADLEAALDEAGIEAVEHLGRWCGYPELRVEYQDGHELRERYDGLQLVREWRSA